MTTTLRALLDVVARRAPDVLASGDVGDGTLISSVTQDSREATHGSLFCAIRGVASDGHDFVADAVANGAAAVLVEQTTTTLVPEVVVQDSRRATGHLAAAFVGNPSDDLSLVGVTGTNGKTSIVSLIEYLVGFCGGRAVSMGTLTGSMTTSPAPQFQAELREHADAGCDVVAAEISSHALDQDRVAGTRVRVAVFSNLSQDHLDYHSDIESYFEAKARLFSKDLADMAVIDVSDPWGRRLAAQIDIPASEIDGSAIADAAVLTQTSSQFTWRGHLVALPLGGRFSVHNAVLAAEACVLLGFEVTELAEGMASVPQVPGRFESIDCGQPFAVVVDYSHTPASVDAAVASARDLTSERVLIVFGAAGDRDPGKRPLMGAAASHADVLYVTSDNPRTEDPDMIIDEVVAGLGETPVHRIPDRRQAINAAITEARTGDVVLIAGKGHEDYQIIGTTRRVFDDRDEARSALAAIGWEVDA